MIYHCEPNRKMLFKVCPIWTSADIPISDYIVLKNRWRMFALELKSQLGVWFLVRIESSSLMGVCVRCASSTPGFEL